MRDFPTIKLADLQPDFPGVFDGAQYVDVGIGWLDLIRNFIAEALPHDPSLAVLEIKEKFGTMRIWCDTDILGARLAKGKAECKSSMTCEVCGVEGHLRRPPPGEFAWWRTLCDDHASPDQRNWGSGPVWVMDGYMQFDNDWYLYDETTDSMLPSEPPARLL